MGYELSLVICGTTAVDAPITDCWLKGGREPLGKRLHRLHVVMTVQQYRAAAFDMLIFRYNHGMSGSFMQRRR